MTQRIAIFGGSFNPPCIHHEIIVQTLTKYFDKVIVVSCGGRKDKNIINNTESEHREAMAVLAFSNLPNTEIDLFDLKNDKFTPTFFLQERYQKKFPKAQIWHVVGGDIISGGENNNSEIQRSWYEGIMIWNTLNFAVIKGNERLFKKEDTPPHFELVEINELKGSSTLVRQNIQNNLPIDELVDPNVKAYIEQHGLYE